ncbi:MAG TPA: gas vesicle protein [Nitrosopumilaceae archaeon]|nr:gas vesicle protein [Nitrosopumilaceae archaeon]
MSLKTLAPKQLTIIDLIDRILDKGVVINGDITISIVGVDLLSLKINLVIASLETAKRYGIKLPWEKWDKEMTKRSETKNIRR